MKVIMKVCILLLGMLLLTGCNTWDVKYFGESYYGIKDNKIVYTYGDGVVDYFYEIIPLQDVSKKTFKIIERGDGRNTVLAQDDDHIYCAGLYITNIDKSSFRTKYENDVLYAVDNNGVYLADERDCISSRVGQTTELARIEGANPQTIQNVYKDLFKDDKNYYLELSGELKTMEGHEKITFIDYQTFDETLAVASNLDWLRDDHRVALNEGDNNSYYEYKMIVDDSLTPVNFNYFGDSEYLRVNNIIFYNKSKVSSQENIENIRVINKQIIASDKNVFYNGRKSEIESPATFESVGSGYYKDEQSVYFIDEKIQKIEGIDLDSLSIIDYYMIKDSSQYFYRGKKIEGADYDSFERIDEEASRDKNNYYYMDLRIPTEDIENFRYCGAGLGYDNENIYRYIFYSGHRIYTLKIEGASDEVLDAKKRHCDNTSA